MLDSEKIKQIIKPKSSIAILTLVLMGASFFLNAATTVPDFNHYKTLLEKKKAFFAYLLPEINKQNNLLLEQRATVFRNTRKNSSATRTQ